MSMDLLRLSECCLSISDGDHQPPPKSEEGIPFITISNINEFNEIDFSECMYVSEDYYLKLSKNRRAQPGDILYSVVGSFGIPILIKNEEPFVFQRHIAILRPDTRKVMPEYLYFLMKNPIFYKMADAYAVGTAQRTIGLTSLRRLKVMLPSMERQKRVVDKLMPYDLLIQNNNKQIRLLEENVEQLYKEWFIRLRFPHNKDLGFQKVNPRGWIIEGRREMLIPREWHIGNLNELGCFIRGKNITAEEMEEGDIPVISAGIKPSGFHNEANVFGKSITVSASGANAGYLKYHLSDIWAADCSYYQDKEQLWFVYCTLHYLERVINNLQCGSAQPHVYPKHLNNIDVIIPTSEVINSFCKLVSPIFEEVHMIQLKNRELIQQRDSILPRLMGGKINV